MHIAIAGMGRMGQTHLKSLALNFPELHLHVVSSRQEGHDFARKFGVEHCYSDLDEALAHPEVTAVIICGLSDAHEAQVEKAIKAGKHIFVEKPLAMELPTIRRLDELAKSRKVHLMVGF
ncbi:MAG TPA: Gfo/Idh/MocA family oxidoreductase, partial [Saprospiraceae bacterium]|nr:Gfo/Idh/MocA family oxidoreductase [Saprospiraceae bacterium]